MAWQARPPPSRVVPQGVKRPVPVPAGAPPGKPSKAARPTEAAETIIVFSSKGNDDIGIRTLTGTYVEQGLNHGKKFYKRSEKLPGVEDMEVFLYFWDGRDGHEFQGWWFGDSVGGTQVWSRNKTLSQAPPKIGWTIPWDGQVKNELCVMNKVDKQADDKLRAVARMEARRKEEDDKQVEVEGSQWEDRVGKATERCAEVQVDVEEAIGIAESLKNAGDDTSKVHEELQTQSKNVTDAQKFIASELVNAGKAPPALKAELQDLAKRLRGLQADLKKTLGGLKSTMVKAEPTDDPAAEDGPYNELEGAHAQQLEEMMPAAIEKVEGAEDEVEKVCIAAAPLQIESGDDLRPVMLSAIKETEKGVRAAQAAIGEARRFISGKLSQVGRFAPGAKKAAVEEFTALQDKLNEAQTKLNPFKTVRQEYEKRAQSKKLLEELSTKIAGAEIEVEKAAMMTAPLGGDSADGIKETETALQTAQSQLAQTNRLVESKIRTTDKNSEAVLEELKALQERGKLAQDKLDEVRKTLKETQVRVAADTLLKEVSDKVALAEDELQKMAEAELPFLRSDKDQDMSELLKEADKVSVKVHTALAEAQSFVARKLVEVARFAGGPGQTVKEEVDMLQKRLEEGRERLQQFRSSIADRKRSHLLEEVESKVSAAEAEVKKMTEATEVLAGGGAAGASLADSLTEAVEQANLAERAAQASVVTARKYLVQKTADLKKLVIASSGSGSGTELGRLQTRVNNMQQDIAKLRGSITSAEERIRVKEMLKEVMNKLEASEGEVEKVAAAAVPVGLEQPSPENVEQMDKATNSAKTKLSATAKLVDVKLKSAQGFLQEELAAMRKRISKAEEKLEKVIRAAVEQKERLQASEFVAQASDKVEKGELAMEKVSEAELPFLKGDEAVAPEETQKGISACEAASSVAQKAITEARSFILQKLAASKELSESAAEVCSKDLLALQKRLDSSASKLAELKKDTAERKRKAQLQLSGDKIKRVEEAVKKLADAMEGFADEKLVSISSDEAKVLCEEIANVEHAAQVEVAGAKKFLGQRVQEAKNLAEAQRASVVGDLGKLQSRLTASQVELAKLSKQCTEREQRYVAHRLVQDASESQKALAEEAAAASKVCEKVLGGAGQADLVTSSRKSAVVIALQAHLKKTNTSTDELWEELKKGDFISKDAFTGWLSRVSELTSDEEASLTKEHALQLWPTIVSKGAKAVSANDFQGFLRERWICAASVPAWDEKQGGKELHRVEAGEGLEVLEQRSGDSKRARCILSRNSSVAWVDTETPSGKPSFKPSPPWAGQLESAAAFIKGISARCSTAAAAAEKKAGEVAGVTQGPLVQVKSKLLEVKNKLNQEQASLDTLAKKLSSAQEAAERDRKAELQELREVRCKAFAEESVQEGTTAVEAAEAKAAKVLDNAKPGSDERLKQMGPGELEELKKVADEALRSLAQAKATVGKLLESHEAHQGPSRQLLLQARVELTKLSNRVATTDRKCRSATESLRTVHTAVVRTATNRAKRDLRGGFRKLRTNANDAFERIAGKSQEVSKAAFLKFVSTFPDKLSDEQASLVFEEFGKYRMGRIEFLKAVQEFSSCLREIDLTDQCSIEASNKVRKIDKSEVLEVVEGPQLDGDSKVERLRVRALRDGVEGWTTGKGNQGTQFLKLREKPLLCAVREANLLTTSDKTSPVIRRIKPDEMLELLEGPRHQEFEPQVFLQGKASKDGAEGFILTSEISGSSPPSSSDKFYTCRSTIAMTDHFDLKQCKVLRKVDIGETLEVIGEPGERADSDIAITRLQFRAARDGKEGWVTLKGNQGTLFVEASDSHYVIEKGASLRSSASTSSEIIRELGAGEAFQTQGPPQEVTPPNELVMKARSSEDWKVGYLCFVAGADAPLLPWKDRWVCRAPVDITSSLSLADGSVIRQAVQSEIFEVVEGPTLDPSGVRRVRCQAVADDGVVGWITMREASGKVLLQQAPGKGAA
eukprot:TRINITY_DN38888_c0_g1_i1.p1 TRINITY_DN38888_c0_g1~~TRINITY_DN38888_c0_g1_i1.p1  ORF type:complete len:1979 (+),score=598.34 TRINITY_DN38888_c0_g1_i1:91-6027(+)